MAFQWNASVDMQSDGVWNFITDPNQHDYSDPITAPATFVRSQAAPKPVGTTTTDSAGNDLHFIYSRTEHYNILRRISKPPHGMNNIGQIDAIVPLIQPISMAVEAILLLSNDNRVSNAIRATIEEAFTNFDARRDGDPDAYMTRVLRDHPDVSADMFRIVMHCVLAKSGPVQERTEARDAILRVYSGEARGTIYEQDGTEYDIHGDGHGYFVDNGIVCDPSASELSRTGPAAQPSPWKPSTPEANIGDVIRDLGHAFAPRQGCPVEEFTYTYYRIAKLLQIPEFKIEWRLTEIDIGCGVHIELHLPVLMLRISDLVLFAFTRVIRDLDAIVLNIIETCAFECALGSAVIGVALGNLPAAIAVFKACFVDCVEDKTVKKMMCLFPGLVLDNVVLEDWH